MGFSCGQVFCAEAGRHAKADMSVSAQARRQNKREEKNMRHLLFGCRDAREQSCNGFEGRDALEQDLAHGMGNG